MKTNKYSDLIKFGLSQKTLMTLSESEINTLHKTVIKNSVEGSKGVSPINEYGKMSIKDYKEIKPILDKQKKESGSPARLSDGDFKKYLKNQKKETKEAKDIQKDNFVEQGVRAMAAESAKGFLYATYDVYKKAHGMASSPENFDN